MSRIWLVVLAGLACVALSGCGGVIDSLREESEAAERDSRREDNYGGDEVQRPPRPARGLSANNVADYDTDLPAAARARAQARVRDPDGFDSASDDQRAPAGGATGDAPTRRRYSRADFVDNQSAENSLWNAQGQSNYYFAQNNRFDNGDLVIVTVDRSLRREIQYALWKSLPAEQRRIRTKRDPAAKEAKGDKTGAAAPASAAAAAPAAAPGAPPGATPPGTPKDREAEERAAAEEAAKSSMGADKDGDMIRMEIMENLGNGLIRLRGEKRVIYRGRPKFVEVTALARGHDIDEQSRANSKSFLDMRSRVVQ